MATSSPQFVNRRHCIFCPNEANSNEHPLPQWLDSVLGPRLDSDFQFNSRTEGPNELPKVKKKSGSPRTKRLRVVCESCNNVWMSWLQDAAKSLMSNLIRDEDVTLSLRDKTILASWMAMTTMVLEFDNSYRAISERERFWLRSLRLPPPTHWTIFAGRVIADAGHTWYFHDPAIIYRRGEPQPVAPNMQRTYLTIGNLLLIACSATIPATQDGVTFEEARSDFGEQLGFEKIWPPSESELSWRALPAYPVIQIEVIANARNPNILLAKFHGMSDILSRATRSSAVLSAKN